MIQKRNIEWWAEKLREPFSLARFGDGEFLCVQGRSGGNSHGCAYTPELRKDLTAILETEDPIIKGIQRLEPWHLDQIKDLLNFGEWYDTEIFADSLARGELKPFFAELQKFPIVLVSSAEKRRADEFLPVKEFIQTPRVNAHAEKEKIVQKILELNAPAIHLFACGMAAGTFVHALHGKIPGASFIDIGHILDPFIGEASRDYLLNIDEDVLMRNIP